MLPRVIVFSLFAQLCLPAISIAGLSVGVAFICAPLVLFLMAEAFLKRPIINRSIVPFLLFAIFIPLSALISWALSRSDVNIRDINEVAKLGQYVPFLLAASVVRFSAYEREYFTQFPLFLTIYVAIGLLQAQGGAVGNTLTSLYLDVDSPHYFSAISGYRVTATGSDPNIGAVIGLFFVASALAAYRCGKSSLFVVGAFSALLVVFMSQSRTAIIALAGVLVVYFVFAMNGPRKLTVFMISGVIITACFYLYTTLELDYVKVGYELALRGDNTSLNTRFDRMDVALERFRESPMFGYGPAKSRFDTIVDSEYALILQRYGVVGMLLLSFILYAVIVLGIRARQSYFGFSLVVMMPIILVVMVTNNFFSGYQLSAGLVVLWIGAIAYMRRSRPALPIYEGRNV